MVQGFLIAQGANRGLGRAIARVIQGEPGDVASLAITVAIAVAGFVAYRWWLDRA